jgi:transcriptional regulator with XRE-family HTH domain
MIGWQPRKGFDGPWHLSIDQGASPLRAQLWRAFAAGLVAATFRLTGGPTAVASVFAGRAAIQRLIERRIAGRKALEAPSNRADPAAHARATATAAEEPVVRRTQASEDASVSAIASRIAELSGLSDQQLADLFKVERETYCRWRTGALTNPRVGNRQRMALLESLMEDLDRRQIVIKDWLLNRVIEDGKTGYELLRLGRIDRVAFLSLMQDEASPPRGAELRSVADAEATGELKFGVDDGWEYPDDEETA